MAKKETWAAWMYHATKPAKLVMEFDGEYPDGWYDCPTKAKAKKKPGPKPK